MTPKEKNPTMLIQKNAMVRELDRIVLLTLTIDSVQVIPDILTEASWGSIVLEPQSSGTAGGISIRKSRKTSCRKILYVWSVKRLGIMYDPTKPYQTLIENLWMEGWNNGKREC